MMMLRRGLRFPTIAEVTTASTLICLSWRCESLYCVSGPRRAVPRVLSVGPPGLDRLGTGCCNCLSNLDGHQLPIEFVDGIT